MGSFIVKPDDFKSGGLKISTTIYTGANLQESIDTIEEDTLVRMLGYELYAEFKQAWESVSGVVNDLPTKFKTIYESFWIESGCEKMKSEGMKQMIKYFIYFDVVQKQPFQNRSTGTKRTKQENSEQVSPVGQDLYLIYNNGVYTYRAIQQKICDNIQDYPNYMGQGIHITGWL